MRHTAVLFSLATVLICSVVLYEGYKYYTEDTVRRACSDTQKELEDTSKNFLFKRANELSKEVGLQPLDSPGKQGIGERLGELRLDENMFKDRNRSIRLSEAELLYGVLGDYLAPSGKCVLFDNMVRMGQGNAISIYTYDYGRAVPGLPEERMAELSKAEYARFLGRREMAGGSCKEPGRKTIFSGSDGETYCQALLRVNRELDGGIERSLEGTKDDASVLYKSVLGNCVSGCGDGEASCISKCLVAKMAAFE